MMIIGYTTGVYDMFHIGHLNVIRRAKENCDYLIVGVSTDELVQHDKGKTPVIPYNERLNLPEHYHFEFRYLFTIDSIKEVKLDLSESSKFKWISIDELREDKNYGRIAEKIDGDLVLISKQPR